jgi:hypothetical protein
MATWSARFGKVARTILYEDESGVLTFSFDFQPRGDQFAIILDSPGKTIITADQARIEQARKRVIEFLYGCGWEVV